jgi:hypothetical protein
MNRFMVFLFVAVMVAGCIGGSKESDDSGSIASGILSEGEASIIEAEQEKSGNTGVLSDLKAAISANVAYRCTYVADGMEAVTYVKGDKQKTDAKNAQGDEVG